MKLTLTDKEKKQLRQDGIINIERNCYLAAPKTSIVHGVGNKCLFDKIAYKWVYGDTEDYIVKMRGEGRRAIDYAKDDRNTWNGSKWYEFNRVIDEFGEIGKEIRSGRKNVITYKMDGFTVSLRPKGTEYLTIVLNIKVIVTKTYNNV